MALNNERKQPPGIRLLVEPRRVSEKETEAGDFLEETWHG